MQASKHEVICHNQSLVGDSLVIAFPHSPPRSDSTLSQLAFGTAFSPPRALLLFSLSTQRNAFPPAPHLPFILLCCFPHHSFRPARFFPLSHAAAGKPPEWCHDQERWSVADAASPHHTPRCCRRSCDRSIIRRIRAHSHQRCCNTIGPVATCDRCFGIVKGRSVQWRIGSAMAKEMTPSARVEPASV